MKKWFLILVILLAAGTSVTCGVKLVSSRDIVSDEDNKMWLSQLNFLYETTDIYYNPCLYLDHFLPSSYKDSNVSFANGKRTLLFEPVSGGKREKATTVKLKRDGALSGAIIKFVRRIVPGSISRKKKPRVLVIGDSVTGGYGAGSNKSEAWKPNQYWAYTKMFFEMQKIDNGDKADEYNALFLGSWTDGSFNIHHKGVERPVRAMAEGYGGASLEQLFEPVFGNAGQENRFYDSEDGSFSVLSYLARYRTLDDNGERLVCSDSNPAGVKVVGGDGKTYVIGTEITTRVQLNTVDVCTPSIIVLNLCHNTSFVSYKKNIGTVVSIIHEELPDTKIVIMTIDESGALFAGDYPEYRVEKRSYGGLHEKNAAIYNYVKDNVEDEKAGVYLLGAQFVMPTMEGFPSVEKDGYYEANPGVLGPNYHPNNRAHEAWGYALFAMIKWILS